jgi:hypothetical protein
MGAFYQRERHGFSLLSNQLTRSSRLLFGPFDPDVHRALEVWPSAMATVRSRRDTARMKHDASSMGSSFPPQAGGTKYS